MTRFGRRLSRRTMLRGATGAAISLPLLEVMRDAKSAETDASVTRLAYLYVPNGVPPNAWQPEEIDSENRIVRLNRWMSDLEPHSQSLTVFRDLWTPRGNGHIAGTATWLTGGGFDSEKLDVGGPSVDQVAADHFRTTTLLPSLEISSRGEGFFSTNLPRNSISWKDSRTPVPREIEPRSIFDRMFRGSSSQLSDRSVLDLVMEDAKRISRRVSTEDLRTVDEYLESVREVERRIEFGRAQTHRTEQPSELAKSLRRPGFGIPDDHEQYMNRLMDMIALAFWSDATRVCTFMMDHGQSNRYFDFINGVTGTWHALSHWKSIDGKTEDDDGKTSWESRDQKLEMYNLVTQWHTKRVAYLLDRLRSIHERGRPLLDQCMIVYGSSLADGHEHQAKNLPVVLAGGGGGTIRGGRVLAGTSDSRNSQLSMSALHLALLQRCGVKRERFAESHIPLELG